MKLMNFAILKIFINILIFSLIKVLLINLKKALYLMGIGDLAKSPIPNPQSPENYYDNI